MTTDTALEAENSRLRKLVKALSEQNAAMVEMMTEGTEFHDWRRVVVAPSLNGPGEEYFECDKCRAISLSDRPLVTGCAGKVEMDLWR